MKSTTEKRFLRNLSRISMCANEFRDTVHVVLFDATVRTMYFDGTHFCFNTGERVTPTDPELSHEGVFYGRIFDLLRDTSFRMKKQALAVHLISLPHDK